MNILKKIQDSLEQEYGLNTGTDIRHFVKLLDNHKELGSLLIDQSKEDDIDLAVLLDRDIFEAWNTSARSVSVTCEEVSHFVYVGFNHLNNRNITRLEMEIQSEVDRIYLAFHGGLGIQSSHQKALYEELLTKKYSEKTYEDAREIARSFVLSLEHPSKWDTQHKHSLRQFFHSDLAEKIYKARKKRS